MEIKSAKDLENDDVIKAIIEEGRAESKRMCFECLSELRALGLCGGSCDMAEDLAKAKIALFETIM